MATSDGASRRIPSIDSLLRSDSGADLVREHGRELATRALRDAAEHLRTLRTEPDFPAAPDDWAIESAREFCESRMRASLRPVLNLTGTVLHTNLGRAPLPEVCLDAVVAAAKGASNLEYRLGEGKRGDRDEHVERQLCELTGAQAATVVNNNAAAVLLTLNSLASNNRVAVSRGELVEIGGSFRIPDIMSRADCTLAEVGTTNRTHPRDYLEAVEDGAVAVMRVHTSNYVVQGFTAAVSDADLGSLAKEHDVMFINDLGSGALIDMTSLGLPAEATPAQALQDGAHVVTFSGDKLLGGPQCGLIVGDRDVIDRIKRNPMKRALRCDKMTLAALEAILSLYANPDRLAAEVPALRLLTRNADDIRLTANEVSVELRRVLGGLAAVEVIECASQIGSGALPVDTLDSYGISITPASESGSVVEKLADAFRQLPVPVIGRIREGALQFDMRCLEDAALMTADLNQLNLDFLRC